MLERLLKKVFNFWRWATKIKDFWCVVFLYFCCSDFWKTMEGLLKKVFNFWRWVTKIKDFWCAVFPFGDLFLLSSEKWQYVGTRSEFVPHGWCLWAIEAAGWCLVSIVILRILACIFLFLFCLVLNFYFGHIFVKILRKIFSIILVF